MSEEYQNLENEETKTECNCDETCGCGCQNDDACSCKTDSCGCYEEHNTYCSRTENLLSLSTIANIVTAVSVLAIAVILGFGTFSPNIQRADNKVNKQQNQEIKPIFKKAGMTLEEAMAQDKNIAVLFYADWCPHCRNFAPTYKELSKDKKLKSNYNFVRINSEDSKARATMEEFGVQGFPALFLVNPKTGEKHFISNNLLFGEYAKDGLIDIFENFANKK